MFKILNGYENIYSNIFFKIKESKITRGHNVTRVKEQSRLDVRKYSFSQRTINVGNQFCNDRVQASSVNIYIISEETSIFAPQRLPFYEALGIAACTVGKVRASTVVMCVCSTFRSSDFFYYSSTTDS